MFLAWTKQFEYLMVDRLVGAVIPATYLFHSTCNFVFVPKKEVNVS